MFDHNVLTQPVCKAKLKKRQKKEEEGMREVCVGKLLLFKLLAYV